MTNSAASTASAGEAAESKLLRSVRGPIPERQFEAGLGRRASAEPILPVPSTVILATIRASSASD
jgi:hypothetical protein